MSLEEEKFFSQHIRVEDVKLEGLGRTKEHIVLREVDQLKKAGTLKEIKDAMLTARSNLEALNIFDAVQLTLDSGHRHSNGCIVIVRVREKKLLNIHTGTYIQGTEGTVEAYLDLKNPFGEAEHVTVGIEHGSQRTNVCSVNYTVPKPGGYPVLADLRLQQLFNDREQWSSYVERLRGGVATITSETGHHALSYELGWRRLSDPSRRASRSTMQHLGDQMKSGLKYSFFAGAMDNALSPKNGWSMRASSELAGLGLDSNLVRFSKQEINAQMVLPVGDDAVLHLEGAAGFLLPWGGQKTCISDRFFLGGVCHSGLRGFRLKGVGPCDARRPVVVGSSASRAAGEGNGDSNDDDDEQHRAPVDALGGDLSWSLLAALRFGVPIESFRSAGLQGQVFVNAGNVTLLQTQAQQPRQFRQVVGDFLGNFRCSVGVGLVWPLSFGRLEVNVSQVVRQQATDRIRTGIQFGFATKI